MSIKPHRLPFGRVEPKGAVPGLIPKRARHAARVADDLRRKRFGHALHDDCPEAIGVIKGDGDRSPCPNRLRGSRITSGVGNGD